ncbi:MAG: aminodeoxyfutalosine deaminase [Fimbriimonadales bacterium]|jgi:5-methylthioadenosine/S-adenosylhomocysteine deaminase|nr:MAG: aminodeoxyfutalosine deaminase [Fimbriimonadales bacterium]
MILRPDAIVAPGPEIVPGLEVCIEAGRIAEIRPWTRAERDEAGLLLSPAFVNAHSHLEYYDLKGKLKTGEYWPWIQEITRVKPTRTMEEVQAGADEAARLNRATGVAAIGEISDWPVSGEAMAKAGLGGRIFQEVITLAFAQTDPEERLRQVADNAKRNAEASGLPVTISPHAPYTVDRETLARLGGSGEFISIHAAEHTVEREFIQYGRGPILELYQRLGLDWQPTGLSPIAYLEQVGCLHKNVQLVHVCDVTDEDIERIAASGASVAHCPRSNVELGCPVSPVAKMRKQGIRVGLGLDSAASSGAVNYFAEMREALAVAGGSLDATDIWQMATTEGAESLRLGRRWEIVPGGDPDLMLIEPVGGNLHSLIGLAGPPNVRSVIRLAEMR